MPVDHVTRVCKFKDKRIACNICEIYDIVKLAADRNSRKFNHVWLCNSENNSEKNNVKQIIEKSFLYLFEEISKFEKYKINKSDIFLLYSNEKFGRLIFDESNITFIDMIKGIFPLKLSDFLKIKRD
uniref:Uncharacterized protein n=1 Tax=Rhizophagus irregularis (strain DAOM 181602 / DAOM 197198 / MUCL 43194) TaxID=747089 RepID=U9TF46_RHIID